MIFGVSGHRIVIPSFGINHLYAFLSNRVWESSTHRNRIKYILQILDYITTFSNILNIARIPRLFNFLGDGLPKPQWHNEHLCLGQYVLALLTASATTALHTRLIRIAKAAFKRRAMFIVLIFDFGNYWRRCYYPHAIGSCAFEMLV